MELRLSGGEPLLIENICKYCKAILDAGLSYTITTNGSLLYKHLEWIGQVPPSTLWISYHREYISVDKFIAYVRDAYEREITVGINLFEVDVLAFPILISQLIQAGASRFKLIHTTPIGRAKPMKLRMVDPIRLRQLFQTQRGEISQGVEIRAELPLVNDEQVGPHTCVLRQRSLLSIDFDGSVYPCCVTLGYAGARVGDLTVESLGDVVGRVSVASANLPCQRLLPAVSTGDASCPLTLHNIA